MSSMWFTMVMFCRIYLIWTQANGDTYLMNVSLAWNESQKYCEGIGKAFFDVKGNDSWTVLNSLLNKPNEAWVAAKVELSHFITQPVCMGTKGLQFNRKEQFNTSIIAKCLKFCKGYRSIGLKKNDCFCFNNTNNLSQSALCSYKCNSDRIHLCGGYESISLYEKVDTLITQNIAPGSKECVYARNTNTKTDLFTASCVWPFADGGMCEGGNNTACKALDWDPLDKQLCRMDLPGRIGWTQIMQMCADIGGRLMSSKIPSSHMKENFTYWLGFHRIGTIHGANDLQLDKNDTYCALARKVGGLVLIEGEDCLIQHAILCQDRKNLDSTASLSTQATEKLNAGKTGYPDEADGTTSYVVSGVSTILVIAIVFTGTAWAIRRRKKSRLTELGTTNSSGEQHTLLERRNTNPPTKPQRKGHSKKEHVQSSYETVVLTRSEDAVMMQNLGHSTSWKEESDRTDLDNEHGNDKDNKGEDPHVYDHSSLHINEYDHTVLSGDKFAVLDETYDRTTLRQQMDITNIIVGTEGDVDSKSGKPVENIYDATEWQN